MCCEVLEPFATCSTVGTEAASFQKVTRYLFLPLHLLLSLCAPQYGLLWAICPFPIIYIYIYTHIKVVVEVLSGLLQECVTSN